MYMVNYHLMDKCFRNDLFVSKGIPKELLWQKRNLRLVKTMPHVHEGFLSNQKWLKFETSYN